jgi:hypothetical protein
MRKLLNEPRVVVPIALVALLWVLVSYGVITPMKLDFFNSERSASAQFLVKRNTPAASVADRAVESLIKEQWLPRRWQTYSALQREPFVANHVFNEVEELESMVVAGAQPEVLPTPKTAEELSIYIVENLGLDEAGFFVRLGSRKIRVGEMLGSQMISQISVPGPRVVTTDTIQLFISQLRLEATSIQSSPRSAQISESYYLEGDLVSRSPVLALYRVFAENVELIDREGRIWPIRLLD